MESDQRRHQKKAFTLLVVDKNKDHQLLIGYCLRAKIPLAEPLFATSRKEALAFLNQHANYPNVFPRMVLLDLYVPDIDQGLYLLKKIRTVYPRLPVIILSNQYDKVLVEKCYELGAHSFLAKPQSLDEWEHRFHILNEYWFNTVTLS